MSTSRVAPPVDARPLAEVLGIGVRGEHQAQHVLGPLGVATDPEHVLEHARHQHADRAGAGHRQHVGEALVGVGRRRLEDPDVLAGDGEPPVAMLSRTLASPPTSGRYADP